MPPWSLRDQTCIAGIGTTDYGVFPDTDAYGLGFAALQRAVDDCGIRFDEIDGLIVNRISSYERFASMAGLNPQFCLHTPGEGRFSGASLMLAAQAIATGNAEVVALVYGNDGKSAGVRYGGEPGPWVPAGFTSPGAIHAMMFQRHMDQYGTRSEDLAHISVAFRRHAGHNPGAVMQKPITVEDHQASRFICEPLHLFDYCLINDGGVAWIMTTPERARDLKKPPVLVSGFARRDSFDDASLPRADYWYTALHDIASKVYERAGIARDELDGLMLYDNFTPSVLFLLEGLGFCKPGEGGDFVRDGTLALGQGRWPTNTSGGHLSESYMQGWALVAEAVRQCRREAGDRQIPDCNSVLYACAANIACAAILQEGRLMATDPPQPRRDPISKTFWEACDEHRLIAQRCEQTGRFWLPPSPLSPYAHSDAWTWEALAGTGTIETWAVMHQRYFPDFPETIPYNVIQVRLDEGPAWISNLIDTERDPEQGLRVAVRFVDYGEGDGRWSFPKFVLA